jgi:amino acid transporter
MEDGGNAKQSLSRQMGFMSIAALGVGAMIGAGVFILTGMAAGEAGPALILAFLFNGLIAFIVGACYAELAAMMPRAGGAYVWAKPGLGPFFGFYSGWMSWFAQTVACSLYALGFGSFTVELMRMYQIPITSFPWMSVTISVAVTSLLLLINSRGAGDTGRFEIFFTGLKVAILLVMFLFGIRVIFNQSQPLAPFTPFLPEGLIGLVGAMGLTFVAFEGYEIIVQTGEEVKNPEKAIPRAIFLSIAVAVFIYVAVAVVLFGAVTTPQDNPVYQYLGTMSELGLLEAAGQFVPYGKLILLFAGLSSTASALNATIYGSTRIAFAMARDNYLPHILSRVHPRNNTPYLSIWSTGAIMIVMTIFFPIKDVAASTNIMFLLVFVQVCATVIALRKKWPDRERPFRLPLSPFLPSVGIISGLGLSLALSHISLSAWGVAGGWIMLGAVVYGFFSKAAKAS